MTDEQLGRLWAEKNGKRPYETESGYFGWQSRKWTSSPAHSLPAFLHTLVSGHFSETAAVARRMKQDPSLDCLYALYKRIPETAGIPPQTVYSALYVSTRPSVWVMHYIAVALGVTLSAIIQEAQDIVGSGKPFKTAGELFKGVSPQGRKAGPPRDERLRSKRRKKGK